MSDPTRWPVKVAPLPWYGGKQYGGKAEWIAGLLPWRELSIYVEPFGGMASVLCGRAPVRVEIYNDLDGRIVNWWRMLRERTDEFIHLVTLTPHSRVEYERARGMLDDPDDLRRAWAFHVVVAQSLNRSVEAARKDWIIRPIGRHKERPWRQERIEPLVLRMRDIQLENKDAIHLLTWLSDTENVVIYCDPPYHTATTNKYQHGDVDVLALTDALIASRGQVAISGYADEWQHLGWQRHEKECMISTHGANKIVEPRTEVLWTNYDVAQMLTATASDAGRLL